MVVNRVPTLDGYIEVEIKDKLVGLEYCIEQTGTLSFLAPALPLLPKVNRHRGKTTLEFQDECPPVLS